MLKKWLDARMKERTTWDGAALIILGLMVLLLAPAAKIVVCYCLRSMDYMAKGIIQLTDAAKDYLAKVGDPNVSLTVKKKKGGGCSGFS